MAKPVVASRAGSLVVLLRYCEDKVRQRLQPVLDEAGLAPEHWRVMALLHERPGLGAGAIAKGAVLPSASVTRHVDKLVERGMVVRRVDPADKRRVVLALSRRGTEVAEALLAEERAAEEIIAAGLGADRFKALARDLALLPHVLD
ncbi:DNA-binding MarR family transcriptional regulator [Marmoricola sp. OAE513]|uniref:MarR family winged helix-turn-helix transcriptional regulator n=1 Tax=Marmoricola sp. OAE513 TaxID=2817894 RepID=UPI001AE57E59